VGVMLGFLVDEVMEHSTWLLAFTAGCFIYVCLTNLLPTILAPHKNVSLFTDMTMIMAGCVLVSIVMA
jgi:zinc transporter ZupT